MHAARFDPSVLKDPSWWHWALTVPCLLLYLAGARWAIVLTVLLCVVAVAYFYAHVRAVRPYPVQIRLAYLVWTLSGLLPAMHWMHWVQLAGTSAMVAAGYCPLARLLKLMPHNRSEPLRWKLVSRRFFRDPCAGGLIQWQVPVEHRPVCCSIRNASVGSPRVAGNSR